ncbi:hypothetical protein ACEYW6_10420 [Nostoc sp. UIC 10607]
MSQPLHKRSHPKKSKSADLVQSPQIKVSVLRSHLKVVNQL